MKSVLISIDPGKCKGGVAVFLDRRLVGMALVNSSDRRPTDQAVGFALEVLSFVVGGAPPWGVTSDDDFELVIEDQVIDARTPNGNSLLWLSKTVGACEAVLGDRLRGLTVTRTMPEDWKGTIPDAQVRARASDLIGEDRAEAKVLADFLARKLPAKDKLHPQAAMGLGLFHLERAGRALVHL